MCGICGIADWKQSDRRGEVGRMCTTMLHRGPDDEGLAQLPGCCLGQRRLAIIDLSPAGHQPMCNEDGRVWVVLNGEIYNFRELAQELTRLGHIFQSTSDTEVVVHGYETWGIKGLCERLTGMFAIGLWDQQIETLYLARDRFGEKPLYYLRHNGELRFASNTQALFAAGGLAPKVDADALVAYLHRCFCSPGLPALQGVQAVPPASFISITNSKENCECYWRASFRHPLDLTPDEWLDQTETALSAAVRRQLVADVPVGCLLSGGVDSSLVAAAAVKEDLNLQLFTVRMPDSPLDESPKAAMVAHQIGGRHHIIDAAPMSMEDFLAFQSTFSEPLGDASSIAVWMIAGYARQHVKVILTGDGGDELFAGYNSIDLNLKAERFRPLFASVLGRTSASLTEKILRPGISHQIVRKALTAIQLGTTSLKDTHLGISHIPLELSETLWGPMLRASAAAPKYRNLLNEIWVDTDANTALDRLLQIDLRFSLLGDYLPKVDTASMAQSLEARTPFLDHHLAELAFAIPPQIKLLNGKSKGLLKALLQRRLGASSAALVRRKQGFVLPIDRWLNGAWSPLLEDLAHSPLIRDGFVKAEAMQSVLHGAIQQPERYSRLRYSLLVLDLWYRNIQLWPVSPVQRTVR